MVHFRKHTRLWRSRVIFIAACMMACTFLAGALYVTFPARTYIQVSFVDVGQGDACLVQTAHGGALLIDGGEEGEGRRTLANYFRLRNVQRLNAAVISHFHDDHVSGILELLEDGFPIEKIYISCAPSESEYYRRLIKLTGKRNIPVVSLAPQDEVWVDGIKLTALYPQEVQIPAVQIDEDANNYSLVARLDYGEVSFLFTGDLEEKGEQALADAPELQADILKVAHHGSQTSAGEHFLEQVRPQCAVISVERGNPYGHPAPATLERLSKRAIQTWRTDRDGTVVVTAEPEGIRNITHSRERSLVP